MTSPMNTRKRADEAQRAVAELQYRVVIVITLITFIVISAACWGISFSKMDAYDRQNQEWNLRQ